MIDVYETKKNFIKVAMQAKDYENALRLLNKWIDDGIARNGYFDDDEIYWLRLQAKNHVKTDDELISLGLDISKDTDYAYAIAYSCDALKEQRTKVMKESKKIYSRHLLEEEKRKAEEAEAKRIAEEKRKAEEAEAKRIAEEKRKAEEAEAKRIAEEKRRKEAAEAEASRIAEGIRKAGISNPMRIDDIIYFGSYPQTRVTDDAIISALGSYASNSWKSYGYYIDGKSSDYMKYTDKTYKGEKYRGVYFTNYRPYYCNDSSSADKSYQDDNGYYTSTLYWFKYEPIKWRMLEERNGKTLIFADLALDSQQYDFKADESYNNNYANSTIRAWLNDTFYNTAFNALQKELIQKTTVDNSVESTGYSRNKNACANTQDNIFLLSYKEVINSGYGFTNDTARRKQSSDYAKSQGCWQSTKGNCWWWLRSPYYDYSYYARYVSGGGYVSNNSNVHGTDGGVLPALVIRLS